MVADDQAVVRDGLVLLLSASDDDRRGRRRRGRRRRRSSSSSRTRPDVALLDLRMPKLHRRPGDRGARRARLPTVRVLVLTTFADDDAILPALRAGAVGYLTKDATGEQLVGRDP